MSLIIEKLNKDHKKSDFDCGNEQLNQYIRKQAKQDVNRDLSICYVLNETTERKVIGFYTLSGNSIDRNDFPADLISKMPPSYLTLPTILLSRLAIDKNYRSKGYGELLLMDALKNCISISETLGILAVVVDPIDTSAIKFYKKYGFILIPSNNKMFIPIKTLQSYN
jgi:GNAT superfamily N-acetyltransferase